MKMIRNIKYGLMLGAVALFSASCDEFLDLEPVNEITPESYYKSADQLATYLNNYYKGHLNAPFSGQMYHRGSYTDEMAQSDGSTDIMCAGLGGNTTYFADGHWQVPSGKQLQGYYGNVRIWNYFLDRAEKGHEAGEISGSESDIKNYIGEGYFFRALNYYRMLVYFGDLPIVKEVLPDANDAIVAASNRAPRNEVARFILEDLDKAISYLYDRNHFNGQRVNKQAALVFKSRVALFEGTFEKYHKGSGRVPGDANWPGAKMSYNSGKSFNIDSEVAFFMDQAMSAAKQVADGAELTENNHVIEPAYGTYMGWNKYFEMYSEASLADVSEVLFWKEYNFDLGEKHNAAWRTLEGSADGYTRAFTESFLMKNGLPIYAAGSGYKGDVRTDDVKVDRDERLQLFVWSDSTAAYTDPAEYTARLRNPDTLVVFGAPGIARSNQETRCVTGYQPRKYYTYEFVQRRNDEINGTNACPIFRVAEAMVNYMEACYEKNGSLDGVANGYWKQLRTRAGITGEVSATIAATDLEEEAKTGNLGLYSGTSKVDATLYNIRRERMCELFSEGLRFADLIRWRSFDKLMTEKWIPQGINFWDATYQLYDAKDIKADGSTDAVVSQQSFSKYLCPYSRNASSNNELYNGYNWHEAYYLYPIGIDDIITASPDRSLEKSPMYQNVNWPSSANGNPEK